MGAASKNSVSIGNKKKMIGMRWMWSFSFYIPPAIRAECMFVEYIDMNKLTNQEKPIVILNPVDQVVIQFRDLT